MAQRTIQRANFQNAQELIQALQNVISCVRAANDFENPFIASEIYIGDGSVRSLSVIEETLSDGSIAYNVEIL